ncbi:MAG TPA: hypothetical protein VJH04_02145 [archaeon]|nr:hypothetical protein [archaeon]
MKLPEKDIELFYKLQWGLMHYVNQKTFIIKGLKSPDFKGQKPEDVAKLHKQIYAGTRWIDEFIDENPSGFGKEELEIIRSWKNFIKEDFFIIIDDTKDGTIFLKSAKEPKAYAVWSLYDDLSEKIPFVPFALGTVLLPFKGKITYSGILNIMKMTFGGNMAGGFREDYQKAKRTFGIITSLEIPIQKKKESDEELLRFYASTQARRFEHENEIDAILKKTPSLSIVYQQEVSKSHTRRVKKRLAEMDITSWFAILEDTIIASGMTKNDVVTRVNQMLPPEKLGAVHIFKR